MSEGQLNLFERRVAFVGELGVGAAQIMGREPIHAQSCGIRLHGIEDRLGRHLRDADAAAFVDGPEHMPGGESGAVIQVSTAALAQLGMGTERTRAPLPTRSTMTQRPSRCWMCSSVSAGGFFSPQSTAQHHCQQRAIAFAFLCLRIRFVDERLSLRHAQPVADADALPARAFDAR